MTFSDADVVAAFPEFDVQPPPVDAGHQKIVYRAQSGGTDVALKIMIWNAPAASGDPVDADEDDEIQQAIERFHREIRGLAAVADCPHVVQILQGPDVRAVGSSEHFWYTEPFLSGGTLKDRLNHGPLPIVDVERLATELLLAVRAMSEDGGFVHRDIKPGNIGFDSEGGVVVIDLGIALFEDMNAITGSSVAGPGTWKYSAPEQFEIRRHAQIDFRTDLFQVGLVVYEALFGVRPFGGRTAGDYVANLHAFDPTPLAQPQIPLGLQRLVPRLLAHSPSERYRRVSDALDELNGGVRLVLHPTRARKVHQDRRSCRARHYRWRSP